MKTWRCLLAILMALVLVAGACGNDDDQASTPVVDSGDEPAPEPADDSGDEPAPEPADDSGDEPAPEPADDSGDEPAPEPADDSGDEPAPEPAGEPIVIGAIAPTGGGVEGSYNQQQAGLNAGVQAVNRAGGVNGRPLELEVCGDERDPNVALGCAQELIDKGVAAFVGNFTNFGAEANPVIDAAGLASIGAFLLTSGDFSAPGVYATNGGALPTGAGVATLCGSEGYQRIAMAYVDTESGAQLVGLVSGIMLPPFGSQLVASVPMALTLGDFSAVAAEIVGSEPDCVMAMSNRDQVTQLLGLLRQQGYDGPVGVTGSAFTSHFIIEEYGEDGNGMLIPAMYDYTSPGYQDFWTDIQAVAPDAVADDLAISSWLAVKIFADIARNVGDDRAALREAASQLSGYDTNGLTQEPLDWTVPGDNPLGLANVRQNSVIAVEIVNGEAVSEPGAWVDIFGR